MRAIWVEDVFCFEHGGVACDCADKTQVWWLFLEETSRGIGGGVQCFGDHFYGTWEAGDGGRTGAMDTLEAAKRAVEARAMHATMPN